MFAAIMARVIAAFIPMRMNKNGAQNIPANSTNLQVTNWTADGSFPGTVIASHRLVMTAGQGKTVTAAMVFTGSNGWSKSGSIRKNGVVIGSTQTTTTGSTTFNFSIPGIDFADGDTLEMVATAASVAINIVAAGTFIRVETP